MGHNLTRCLVLMGNLNFSFRKHYNECLLKGDHMWLLCLFIFRFSADCLHRGVCSPLQFVVFLCEYLLTSSKDGADGE